MEAIFPVVVLIGLLVSLVASIFVGTWVLEPVNKAAGHLQAPTRFMLTDFIWLMIQLQIVLGLVAENVLRLVERGMGLAVLAVPSVLVLVLWIASVSVVSRAGIVQPLKRAAVILILVPGSLAVLIAGPFLMVGCLTALATIPLQLMDSSGEWGLTSTALLLLAGVATALSMFGLRRLSFWVLTRSAASLAVEKAAT